MRAKVKWAHTSIAGAASYTLERPAPDFEESHKYEVIEVPRRFRFTNATVEDLPFTSAGQRLHWDETLPGFGVVVGKTAKSFIVQKDMRGKSCRDTIGKFPVWTVEVARQEGRGKLVEMDRGVNPHEVAKEHAKRQKEQELREAEERMFTLCYALDCHLEGNLKASTKSEYKSTMKCVFGDWMEKPIIALTRDMVLLSPRPTGCAWREDERGRLIFSDGTIYSPTSTGGWILTRHPTRRMIGPGTFAVNEDTSR